MSLRIACPRCRKPFVVPARLAGHRCTCDSCATVFAVPNAAAALVAVAAEPQARPAAVGGRLPDCVPSLSARPRRRPPLALLVVASVAFGLVMAGVALAALWLFRSEPAPARASLVNAAPVATTAATGRRESVASTAFAKPPAAPHMVPPPEFLAAVSPAAPPQAPRPYPDRPYLVLDTGGHTSSSRRVAFTPDGRYILTVSMDKSLRVWDRVTGESTPFFRPSVGTGLDGALDALAVAPDGKTVATAGVTYGRGQRLVIIYLIAMDSGRVVKALEKHRENVTALAFSPDGKHLASASSDLTIRLWDVASGREEQVLEGLKGSVNALAFAPDGKRLASASQRDTPYLWSLTTGKLEATLRDGAHLARCIAWSPDGKTIAVGNEDATLSLWEPNGKLRQTLSGLTTRIFSVTFTPDSREVLFTGADPDPTHRPPRGGGLIDIATGKVRVSCDFHNNSVIQGDISRDGKLAATTGGNDHEFYLWNTADGSVVQRFAGKGQSVWGVGWSPDGKAIAWTNINRILRGENYPRLHRAFHLGELQFADVPLDQCHRARLQLGKRFLAIRRSGPLRELEITEEGNREVRGFKSPTDSVQCCSWLPDGRVLVGTAFKLFLIDAVTCKVLREYKGPTGGVWDIAPSPDGKRFVSGSGDQILRVWDVEREQPLLSFFVADQDWIAWTEEGVYAASGNGERLMGWQVNNDPEVPATFHAAGQFRKSLYHPEVIKQVLAAGSTAHAFELAGKKSTEALSVAQVLPPTAAITAPAGLGNVRVGQSHFEVKASAQSTGRHPVTALRLLVDGRPYKGQAGLRPVASPKLGEVTASWPVELEPGLHQLAVLAESAVSRSLSPVVEVTVAGPGNPLPSLYVLAVGIDAYPAGMQLQYAGADADAITQALRGQDGKMFRKVEVKLVKDREATRKGIEQGLAWLGSKMTAHDVGVMFFSGHGHRGKDGTFYLVPADVSAKDLDGTCVSGDFLKKALGEMPGRVIAVLDACHSGAAGEGSGRRNTVLADDLVRDLITDDYGVIVLSSSLGREYSLESSDIKHGFFTLALVEGLSGKADFNKDGLVYLNELDVYATRRVKLLTQGRQNPVMARPAAVRSFPLARP